MDTSETYIKMCEKAVEIWKYDFYLQRDLASYPDGVHCIVHRNEIYSDYWYIGHQSIKDCVYKVKLIWLPRQDQLQEMVSKGLASWESYAFGFGDWCLKHYKDYGQLGSMEQLWLAFVMKEKYNKCWSGNEWIE